jgi:predicted N-formylglutamate amidohydrolase
MRAGTISANRDKDLGETLLGADDPAPVEVLRAGAPSPFFLTCEHSGKFFPRRLGTLGLDPHHLDRHIAYDIGAAGVARGLSRRLDAHLVLQSYSRLVVDCNRWPTAPDFITTLSEDTEIPGNMDIDQQEIKARTEEIFLPYHDTIATALDERESAGRTTVLVAVHSCTPVFHGVSRPWHVGVLHEHDPRLAQILLELLHGEGHLCVGDNEPYFMTSDKDYAVPVHGHHRELPHVELEIRQDLIETAAGQEEWGEFLAGILREALGRLREDGHI